MAVQLVVPESRSATSGVLYSQFELITSFVFLSIDVSHSNNTDVTLLPLFGRTDLIVTSLDIVGRFLLKVRLLLRAVVA